MTADDIIQKLGLERHPEGGWYRQTWEGDERPRAAGTCIYFLLKAGERSHWHRVDATEIWHFYGGEALTLRMASTERGPQQRHILSPDLDAGSPQIIVPDGWWQSAETTGAYTLVGCTVSPGFRFDGFELAAPEFDIPT